LFVNICTLIVSFIINIDKFSTGDFGLISKSKNTTQQLHINLMLDSLPHYAATIMLLLCQVASFIF